MTMLALPRGPMPERRGIAAIEYTLLAGLLASCLLGVLCAVGSVGESSVGVLSRRLAGNPAPPTPDVQAAPQVAAAYRVATNWSATGRKLWLMSVGVAALAASGLSWRKLRARLRTPRDRRGDLLADLPRNVPRDRLFAKRHQILKVIEHDLCALLEGRLQVRHLMSTSPLTVAEDCPVAQLRQIMAERGMHHLMVCDSAGQLLGVVSDRDLGRNTGSCAGDIMTRDVVTVTPDTLISPAVTLLIDRRISSLPVVDGGKPCGVLTTTDLVMSLQCTLQAMLKLTGAGTRASDAPCRARRSVEAVPSENWTV